jgi:hypothetical protein
VQSAVSVFYLQTITLYTRQGPHVFNSPSNLRSQFDVIKMASTIQVAAGQIIQFSLCVFDLSLLLQKSLFCYPRPLINQTENSSPVIIYLWAIAKGAVTDFDYQPRREYLVIRGVCLYWRSVVSGFPIGKTLAERNRNCRQYTSFTWFQKLAFGSEASIAAWFKFYEIPLLGCVCHHAVW